MSKIASKDKFKNIYYQRTVNVENKEDKIKEEIEKEVKEEMEENDFTTKTAKLYDARFLWAIMRDIISSAVNSSVNKEAEQILDAFIETLIVFENYDDFVEVYKKWLENKLD